MFINRVRKPDGRLFQGRSILELVRKLDICFDDLVEIPARLQRIERKLDKALACRPRLSTKLCLTSIAATWPQERYTPAWAVGGFARVPLPLIRASNIMAAGEYRVLLAILFCAKGTGLLQAGKKTVSKLANVAESDFYHFRDSLHNRQIIRPTGRILRYGTKEYEVLTHSWLCEDESLLGGEKSANGGEIDAARGRTVPPLKNDKKIPNKTTDTSSIISGSYQNHIKWPEFAAYAKLPDKIPTAKWFERWLAKQRPEWRNRKSPKQEILEEVGWVLDGKFYKRDEAIQLATQQPKLELTTKFRRAVKRNGKIKIIEQHET